MRTEMYPKASKLAVDGPALTAMMVVALVWSVCLWVLGGKSFGLCWAGMVELAAAEAAATGAALALWGVAVRLALSLTYRIRPYGLAMRLALAGQKQTDPSSSKRLLYRLVWAPGRARVVGLACLVGGLASTALVGVGGEAMAALGRIFVLPARLWALPRIAAEVLTMLPLGAALAGLMLAAASLKAGGGRDVYHRLARMVLRSAAIALVASAAMWWLGLNLLGVALTCPVLLIGLILATVLGPGTAVVSPPPSPPPASGRSWPGRLLNGVVWGALAAVLVVQCRLLRDCGATWPITWLWAGGSAALLLVAAGRLSRRVRPGRAVEFWVVVAAVALAAGMQFAAIKLAAIEPSGAVALILLTIAAQWPVAILAATVLDRRRRLFARIGTVRFWLADMALGVSAGAMAALLAFSVGYGGVLATVVGMAVVGAGALAGASERDSYGSKGSRSGASGRIASQLRWALTGAAGVAALAALGAGAALAQKACLGAPGIIGASLTAVRHGRQGTLPMPLPARVRPADPEMAAMIERLMRSKRGRWWLIGAEALPNVVGGLEDVSCQFSVLDESFRPLGGAAGEAPVFARLLARRSQQFDGVYLAGLPADHPDAWCFYSREVLTRCAGCLFAGGWLIVHTSAGPDGLADVMAVARTFQDVCGGYAVVSADKDGIEITLLGRRGDDSDQEHADLSLASARTDVTVFTIPEILAPARNAETLSITTAGRRPEVMVSLDGYARWLNNLKLRR